MIRAPKGVLIVLAAELGYACFAGKALALARARFAKK